jgi:hypothetical protein
MAKQQLEIERSRAEEKRRKEEQDKIRKEVAELVAKANTMMTKAGMTNEEAAEVSELGLKSHDQAQKLLDTQKSYQATAQAAGSTRLGGIMKQQASMNLETDSEITKVATVADKLASVKSYKDFKTIIDKEGGLLKKSGAAGVSAVNTSELLEKVGNSENLADLKGILKTDFTSDIADAFRSGGKGSVQELLLQKFQTGTLGGSAISSSGGGLTDGTSAEQTLKQQVDMNQQILVIMQGLAKRVGV